MGQARHILPLQTPKGVHVLSSCCQHYSLIESGQDQSCSVWYNADFWILPCSPRRCEPSLSQSHVHCQRIASAAGGHARKIKQNKKNPKHHTKKQTLKYGEHFQSGEGRIGQFLASVLQIKKTSS